MTAQRTVQRFYLGVDGGATKTHALIADQNGQVHGAGHAGEANWENVGLDRAAEHLAMALREALKSAGLKVGQLRAAGFGLAGMDWPSDQQRLAPVINRLGLTGQVVLVNDADLALRAGTLDGAGVAVIAGTGTNVVGRNPAGDYFRTFGVGSISGEVGGGWDVTARGLAAVSQSHIGRLGPTMLTERFMQAFGYPDVVSLFEGLSRDNRTASLSKYAPVVFEAAADGDAIAQGVIRFTGEELGKNAAAIARKLGFNEQPFDLVLAGGIFHSRSELLLNSLVGAVRAVAPGARPVPLTARPVMGAIMLALDAGGETISRAVQQSLTTNTIEHLGKAA